MESAEGTTSNTTSATATCADASVINAETHNRGPARCTRTAGVAPAACTQPPLHPAQSHHLTLIDHTCTNSVSSTSRIPSHTLGSPAKVPGVQAQRSELGVPSAGANEMHTARRELGHRRGATELVLTVHADSLAARTTRAALVERVARDTWETDQHVLQASLSGSGKAPEERAHQR